MPMSVIDVAWLVFGLGLFGVVHRPGEMMLGDAGSMSTVGITLGFIRVCLEVDWGVVDKTLSLIALKNDQD